MELAQVEITPLQTPEPTMALITTAKQQPEEEQLKVKTMTTTAIDNKATIQETKVPPLQDPTVALLMEVKTVVDLIAEEAAAATVAAAVVQDHQEEAEDN